MQPSYFIHQTLLSPSRDLRFPPFYPPSSPIANISYAPILTINTNPNNNNLDNSFYYQSRSLTPLARSQLTNTSFQQENYINGGGGLIRTEYVTNNKQETRTLPPNPATDNSFISSKKASEKNIVSNKSTLPPTNVSNKSALATNNASNLKSPTPNIKVNPPKPNLAPEKKKEEPNPKKSDPIKSILKPETSKKTFTQADKEKLKEYLPAERLKEFIPNSFPRKEEEDLKKLISDVSKKEEATKRSQPPPPSKKEEEPKKTSNFIDPPPNPKKEALSNQMSEKGSKKENNIKKEEASKINFAPSSQVQKNETSKTIVVNKKKEEFTADKPKLSEFERNKTENNLKNDENLRKFICELPEEGSDHLSHKINREKVDMTVEYLLRRKKPVEEVVRGLVEENLILRELFTERCRENEVLKAMHEGDMLKIEQILQENVKLNHSMGVINGEINDNSELKKKIGGLTNVKETLERENERLKRETNQVANLKENLQRDFDRLVICKETLENENVDLSKKNERFLSLTQSCERLRLENESISKENKVLLSKVKESETELNETLDAKERFKKNNFLEKEEINRVKEELRREKEELIKTKETLNREREERNANRNMDVGKFNKMVKFSEGLERRLKEQANEIDGFKENLLTSIQKQDSQIENYSSLKSILTSFPGNSTGTYKAKIKDLQNELLQCHVCISDLEKKLKSQNLGHSRTESKDSSKLHESMFNDSSSSLKKSTHLLDSNPPPSAPSHSPNFLDSTSSHQKPKQSQFLKNNGMNKTQKLDDLENNRDEKSQNNERANQNQELDENQFDDRNANYIKSNASLNKTQRLEESLLEESDLLTSQIKHWKEIAVKNGRDNEGLMSLFENKKNELIALSKNYEHLRKENRELKRRMLGMEEKMEGMQKEKQEFKEIIENQSFLMRDREVELEERMSEVDDMRNRYREAICDISQHY